MLVLIRRYPKLQLKTFAPEASTLNIIKLMLSLGSFLNLRGG